MFIPALLLMAALSAPTVPLTINGSRATAIEVPGGPPSIRLAKKAKGDISLAEWNSVRDIDLVGCVPDARITVLTICIRDCKGKEAMVTADGPVLTPDMRTMVRNLPPGTDFTVKVEVKDAKGNFWKVPPATFTWKG
jgi:hypothetical protein